MNMEVAGKVYFEARGFSTYYFANAVFNIVMQPLAYLRGIEDILGDMRTQWYGQPFKKYTNLHEFARSIIEDVVTGCASDNDDGFSLLRQFLHTYEIKLLAKFDSDEDSLAEALGESREYDDAIESLTDEVFHVLFQDVAFLYRFNMLVAGYLKDGYFNEGNSRYVNPSGNLKRVRVPVWAKSAIYYRDKGECRCCKKSLARSVSQIDSERYDHIVPLSKGGANDVTNLQLLCERCNSAKTDDEIAPSRFYQRALQGFRS